MIVMRRDCRNLGPAPQLSTSHNSPPFHTFPLRETHRRVELCDAPLVLPGPADAGPRPAAARGRHLAGAVALAPRRRLPVAEVGDATAVQLQERIIGLRGILVLSPTTTENKVLISMEQEAEA